MKNGTYFIGIILLVLCLWALNFFYAAPRRQMTRCGLDTLNLMDFHVNAPSGYELCTSPIGATGKAIQHINLEKEGVLYGTLSFSQGRVDLGKRELARESFEFLETPVDLVTLVTKDCPDSCINKCLAPQNCAFASDECSFQCVYSHEIRFSSEKGTMYIEDFTSARIFINSFFVKN